MSPTIRNAPIFPTPLRPGLARPHAVSHAARQALALLAALGASSLLQAQTAPASPEPAAPGVPAIPATPATPATPAPAAEGDSARVIVTGNPLGRRQASAPASVLSGEALLAARADTLGQTLDGLPGVSATAFAPQVSRPVVRGLDGDRVRILSNGGATRDASALSYDHAVPLDPLVATRIEVLRGPAALLHGGGAAGGVVNVIDSRLPQQPGSPGLHGAAELRAGSAARDSGGGATLDWQQPAPATEPAGAPRWLLHADAFTRQADDTRTPWHVPEADGQALAATRTVRNSAGQARGGALAATLFAAGGRIGLAVDSHDSRYGVVAEPDVTIAMRREQLRLAAQTPALSGPFDRVDLDAHLTDYRHQEIAGDGTVGTTFASRGHELRLAAHHRPVPLAGGRADVTLGLSAEAHDFSALGEEAFVPGSHSRRAALFLGGEWSPAVAADARAPVLSAALRLERAQVESQGGQDSAGLARFGGAQRRGFTLPELALGWSQPLGASAWRGVLQGSLSARAPTDFELYANGLHAATGAWEQGDAALGVERGRQLELALERQHGADRLRLGLWGARYDGFIALQDAGVTVDAEGQALAAAAAAGGVPLYRFEAVRARLWGLEAEAATRLQARGLDWDLGARLDGQRGDDLDHRAALPRLAPWRLTLDATATWARTSLGLQMRAVARQDRVAPGDTPTPGHVLWNAHLAQRLTLGGSDATLLLRLTNLGNRLAYNASALQTVRSLTPQAERAVSLVLRLEV